MARTSRKTTLLDAAARIVAEQGAEALTLDAVAAATGTSKGGVLYHFPTKQALVTDLVEQLVGRFEQRLAPASKDFVRSYIEASLQPATAEQPTAAGLAIAVAAAPQLLDPLRQRYPEWDRRLTLALGDRTRALTLRLALDGLWFADVLNLAPPSPSDRKRLLKHWNIQYSTESSQAATSVVTCAAAPEPAQTAPRPHTRRAKAQANAAQAHSAKSTPQHTECRPRNQRSKGAQRPQR